MDNATMSVSSSCNNEETGMQQIASDLQALKRLYGLLHKGSADENLDETSKALMLKMLDDATQQALLKQAKMLSGSLMSPVLERKLSVRSDRRAPHDAEPRLSLKPPASPSLLAAGESPSRLNPQYSTVSSRPGGHVDGNSQAAEEPLLTRLASYRSSRTTASALLPPRHRPGGGEQRNSGLSLYRLPVAATSRHGTVAGGSSRRAGRRDTTLHGSSRGDQSPLPEGSGSSSGRRSVSREVSLGQARRHGSGVARHVGAESCSSTRRFGRLGSGLSLGMASRRGSERAGRGEAWPEQSSSSNTVATIRSRIRPNQDLKERRLQRRAEGGGEEESTPRRRSTDASVSSSSRGDRSSPEGSSRRSSVSRELSLGRPRLHGRAATRHEGGGGEGSCSTRRFGRSGSELSLGLASRRGSERAGRSVASRERHSLSNTKASRTRPKPSQSIKERSLRRAEADEGESSRRRQGRTDASVSSGGRTGRRLPRRALKRIDSGSMYMSRSTSASRAAISCPSTSPTVSPEPSNSAASYSPPPPVSRRGLEPPGSRRGIPAPSPVSWRGMAPPPPVTLRGMAPPPPPPVYAPRVTRSMRRQRRLEVLEKRVGQLRMLKSKIAMVFHHRHDHHHHFGRGGQEEAGPSSRAIPGEHHRGSPWRFLGGMFHHGKEKTTSRTVVAAPPAKRRGGGGNIHALFDAVRRHMQDKRRAPVTASVKMRRTANRSRALAKKMHWWERLKQRRVRKEVAAGRPRRRLGLGKF
ncbi:unnamed protein product [Urochloa humidicola]